MKCNEIGLTLIGAIFIGLFSVIPSQAALTGSTGWYLTDNDGTTTTWEFNTIGIQHLEEGWQFGIYDLNEPHDRLVHLTDEIHNAVITYESGNIRLSGGGLLDVGGSGIFGIYFLDTTATSDADGFFTEFPVSTSGGNQWAFESPEGGGAGGPVFFSDIAPVPIPTTLILFGCGLVGLVGISRKHRK
jgi:hypothetical protein